MLIVCCDGLPGLPEVIETIWPKSTVQTCTAHLIRAAMRYVSYNDRKRFAVALRPVYTATTADAALLEWGPRRRELDRHRLRDLRRVV